MGEQLLITGETSGRKFARGKFIMDGWMGEVHEATENNVVFAMKSPIPLDSTVSADCLTREAHEQAKFAHPHITRVVLFDRTRNLLASRTVPFLITPLADTDLRRRIYDSPNMEPLTIKEAFTISEHTADALAAIHNKGLLHGAITVGNVLLRKDSQESLLAEINDFGETVTIDEARTKLPTPHGFITPPEINSGQYTPATEQFYWAANIVYPAVVGKPPFDIDPFLPLNIHSNVNRQTIPSLIPGKPTVLHEVLDAVVGKALQLDPRNRYPSMGALLDDLRVQRLKANRGHR